MKRLSAVVLLVALAGCGETPTEIPRPPGAVPFTPPAIYETYYMESAACAGLPGDYASVRWFVVPDVYRWESTATGVVVVGEWWPPHDIYLAEHQTNNRETRDLVMHESLHELLQARSHPVPPFEECAPVTI